MTASRNTVTTVAAVKLGIFVLVSVLVTGVLTAIMGSFGFGGQKEFKALFSSASLLVKGDDVRVAGVKVGEVTDVEVVHRDEAQVSFKVAKDVPVSTTTRAEIRFLNLVGDRYLALAGDGRGTLLPDGDTIPEDRTEPALNLTELFAGFQPLFQALQPAEVNELSMNLVRVLQGEGGTVATLMNNTASLTNALADRDKLIGEVIDNLSAMLQTVDQRHTQLNTLVIQLKDWLGRISRDRHAIGASLQNLSGLTAELADLLTRSRPYLKADVAQLRRLLAILNKPKNQAVLDEVLNRLPLMLERQTRTGTYGSWYNYYLCDFSGSIILPDLPNVPGLAVIQAKLKNMAFHSTAKRCDE